jgi:hypothetical protein
MLPPCEFMDKFLFIERQRRNTPHITGKNPEYPEGFRGFSFPKQTSGSTLQREEILIFLILQSAQFINS